MSKLQLSIFFLLSCLHANAQIHQNTPFEQKRKIAYDAQTDSLLRSASTWLNACKSELDKLSKKNTISINIDSFLYEIEIVESKLSEKRHKQKLIQNSKDTELKDVKIAGRLNIDVSKLYNDVVILNKSLHDSFRQLQEEEKRPNSSKTNFKNPFSENKEKSEMPRAYNYISVGVKEVQAKSQLSFTSHGASARSFSEIKKTEIRVFTDTILNEPTSHKDITSVFLKDHNEMSLSQVSEKVTLALKNLNYVPKIFLNDEKPENGFLIQARVEQMKANGESINNNDKFKFNTINIFENSNFSLKTILESIESLYKRYVGHYRLFIIQVKKNIPVDYKKIYQGTKSHSLTVKLTANDVYFSNPTLARDEDGMPKEFQEIKLSNGYICRVLIFEFQREAANLKPKFVPHPNITPDIHLKESKILEKIKFYIENP